MVRWAARPPSVADMAPRNRDRPPLTEDRRARGRREAKGAPDRRVLSQADRRPGRTAGSLPGQARVGVEHRRQVPVLVQGASRRGIRAARGRRRRRRSQAPRLGQVEDIAAANRCTPAGVGRVGASPLQDVTGCKYGPGPEQLIEAHGGSAPVGHQRLVDLPSRLVDGRSRGRGEIQTPGRTRPRRARWGWACQSSASCASHGGSGPRGGPRTSTGAGRRREAAPRRIGPPWRACGRMLQNCRGTARGSRTGIATRRLRWVGQVFDLGKPGSGQRPQQPLSPLRFHSY